MVLFLVFVYRLVFGNFFSNFGDVRFFLRKVFFSFFFNFEFGLVLRLYCFVLGCFIVIFKNLELGCFGVLVFFGLGRFFVG